MCCLHIFSYTIDILQRRHFVHGDIFHTSFSLLSCSPPHLSETLRIASDLQLKLGGALNFFCWSSIQTPGNQGPKASLRIH